MPGSPARACPIPRTGTTGEEGNEFTPPGARIYKRLWRPEIDSEESISPAYVACLAGTTKRVVAPARQPENRFLGSIKGLQIRAQPLSLLVVGWGGFATGFDVSSSTYSIFPLRWFFLGDVKKYRHFPVPRSISTNSCVILIRNSHESGESYFLGWHLHADRRCLHVSVWFLWVSYRRITRMYQKLHLLQFSYFSVMIQSHERCIIFLA
jgi:hypothetical protein